MPVNNPPQLYIVFIIMMMIMIDCVCAVGTEPAAGAAAGGGQVVHFVGNRCRVDLQRVGALEGLHCGQPACAFLCAFLLLLLLLQNESWFVHVSVCEDLCSLIFTLWLAMCNKAHGLSNVGWNGAAARERERKRGDSRRLASGSLRGNVTLKAHF